MEKYLLIFLRALLFFGFFAFANALTFKEALDVMVLKSPELRSILEKREQSYQSYLASKASYKPSVRGLFTREMVKDQPLLDPSYSPWEGTGKLEIYIDQVLFDMAALGQVKKYRQLVQSEEFQNQRLLEQLIVTGVMIYYNVVEGQYVVAINRDYLKKIKEVERVVIAMYKNGDATLGDVNFTQARVASASASYVDASSGLDQSKVKMAYFMGLIKDGDVIDPANVLPELVSTDFFELSDRMVGFIPLTLEDMQDAATKNNSQALVLRSNLCAAVYDLDSSRGKYLPSVTLEILLKDQEAENLSSYQREGKISIYADYYLYDGGKREATVNKYRSVIRELESNYDSIVRDLKTQSFTLFSQVKSLEKQRGAILKEVEATEEVDKVYSLQFKFAARNLTDRLDNLERMLSARSRLIELDYSILTTRLDVLTLTGKLVYFFGYDEFIDSSNLRLC